MLQIIQICNCSFRKKALRHTFKIPNIDFSADKWWDLVDVDEIAREPTTTMGFTDGELEDFLEHPLEISIAWLPSHSQGVERAVKMVSEVSMKVYGFEARHEYLNVIVESRELRPAFTSKGQYKFKT